MTAKADAASDVKVWSVMFFELEVRRITDGRQNSFRINVAPQTSTVLGNPAKTYWPNLHFELAEYRRTSLAAAIVGDHEDIHLAVPWRHPDDASIPLAECGKYAVRPVYQRGDHVKAKYRRGLLLEVLSVVPVLEDGLWRWEVAFRRLRP